MNELGSKRLLGLKPGVFARLAAKKIELENRGMKTYSFFVGTPDIAPPEYITAALAESAEKPEKWKYSLLDSDELLNAVSCYYRNRFGVDLDPANITSVHGTQEGMVHLGMALLNEGDTVLLPDPGYPAYEAGAILGGAEIFYYPLLEKNDYLPDLGSVPEEILYRAKYIVVSYPSNPVGAVAPKSMYTDLISAAKKYGFLIINDNAYSDLTFDGYESCSILSFEDAYETSVEFMSLSKSFNVTGARLSFLSGNSSVIEKLKHLRSQFDFGMFYPEQDAAIAALTGPLDFPKYMCSVYEERRNILFEGLESMGWKTSRSHGTMFAWVKLPEKYTSSVDFCNMLADRTGIICTPGSEFGPSGEGYIRFALVYPAETMKEVIELIRNSGIM